ncbi:MAG: hypothetical protein M1825_001974 [Sarcosagium campestre]|nr:MAG: hypothetical protein M1825_001974 [Sarcosagium campestre]
MPLRAKLLPQYRYGEAKMSTSSIEIPKELPGDEEDDVLFNSLYGLRSIELNRPKKLNSLNGSMARKIVPRLKEWEKSDMANVIIVKGAGEKAFCAGGDVAALAQYNSEGPAGREKSIDYFGLEYKLDHLIATYNKPYVAFMDGITMGGGVGLSVHAPFRIATERTVFAMPETTIGFFPDVGGSFFLPRLDGKIGTYTGIATHYLHSSSLSELEERLSELTFHDYASLPERNAIVSAAIEEFSTGLPPDEPIQLGGPLRSAIDRCFSSPRLESILATLRDEPAPFADWAAQTLATLHERSPTSVRVALRQMQLGARWRIAEAFQREHALAVKFMSHPDFAEGVTARLIRKPPQKPAWQPASLEETSDAPVDALFAVEGSKRLALLSEGDYDAYPHADIGLPTERQVSQKLTRQGGTKQEIIDAFVRKRRGKDGVAVKVAEILDRKTKVDGKGRCQWVADA